MRAEQSRAEQIDVLKAVCAFLIVCIHAPFPGAVGEYFTALTRVAVPIFFMITGFFYADVVGRGRRVAQIKKIFSLNVKANVIFLIWKVVYNLAKGRQALITFMADTFSAKAIMNFLLFNDNCVGSHLWYLSAILYVLIIVYMADRLNLKRLLIFITPLLLFGDLVLGKYSLLLIGREIPYYYVRNFLFVGIPYFCIGNIIHEYCNNLKRIKQEWLTVAIVLFSVTTVLERLFLISVGKNAIRDHYLSTTFLAISVFAYALRKQYGNVELNKAGKILSIIGRKYSTDIYILHPIIISIVKIIFGVLGLGSIYTGIAPIVVYLTTVVMLNLAQEFQRRILNR